MVCSDSQLTAARSGSRRQGTSSRRAARPHRNFVPAIGRFGSVAGLAGEVCARSTRVSLLCTQEPRTTRGSRAEDISAARPPARRVACAATHGRPRAPTAIHQRVPAWGPVAHACLYTTDTLTRVRHSVGSRPGWRGPCRHPPNLRISDPLFQLLTGYGIEKSPKILTPNFHIFFKIGTEVRRFGVGVDTSTPSLAMASPPIYM